MTRAARILERLPDERGTTLIELMVALSISMVVLLAVFQILDDGVRASGRVGPRVTATQDGRLAMEQVTRQLRSQACLAPGESALVSAGNNEATFYVDFVRAGGRLDKHRLVYDPQARTIVEEVSEGTGTAPTWTFPAQPTRTRTLARNVVPASGTPVFRYYAFNTATPARPELLLTTPLSATDRLRAVRIAVRFAVRPEGDGVVDVDFQSEIFVRTADPTNPVGGTQCV